MTALRWGAWFALVGWSVSVAGAEAVGATAKPPPAEAEIRALVMERYAANARNDRAFYEQLLADNFRLLPPYAQAVDRQHYLDAEFPPGRPARAPGDVRNLEVHVAGDTATVSYRVVEHYPISADVSFDTPSTRLESYVRIGGAWRLLTASVADVAGWPEVAKIDAALYADYIGVYELSPTTRIRVSVEAGHLMAEIAGQGKVELFPESATSFFDRSDHPLARTVFERNAEGRVVAQVYRAHGQSLRARKIE
jgi:hypothetical protein